ncbi:hypothetical protein Peur_022308 [Populus x canadensis]
MSHYPEESSHGYYVIIFAARFKDSSSRNTLTSLRFKHREYYYLPEIQGFKLQEYSYLPEIQAAGVLDGVLKTVKAIGGT